MPLQRATTLYPVNSTTVDTGTGIDVRLLSNTEAGATDSSQSIRVATQNTNAERTFDPANANVTVVNNAQTTLAKLGWAFNTSDMAPTDAACVVSLAAQSCTVSWTGTSAGTGSGNLGANDVFTPKISLWKYNTSTDTGTLIVGGAGTAVTHAAAAYSNSPYSASVTVSVPATTFAANEVLYLQIGGNLACGAGLLGGARTTTWTLSVDVSTTNLVFATSGLLNVCTLSSAVQGEGSVSRDAMLAITPVGYSTVAAGAATYTRLSTLAKTFALTAIAIASRTGLLVLALPRDLIALASSSYSRQVTAQRTSNLTAQGSVVSYNRALSIGRLATGIGTVAYLKQVTASKSFDLTGVGTPYYSKFTIANREFTVVGQGKIVMTGPNASTIAMPIDDIPDGGAPPSNTYIFPVLD